MNSGRFTSILNARERRCESYSLFQSHGVGSGREGGGGRSGGVEHVMQVPVYRCFSLSVVSWVLKTLPFENLVSIRDIPGSVLLE